MQAFHTGMDILLNYLLSFILFALISLDKNFHDPRKTPSGRKVCVGGGWWWVGVEGNLSVSFGPKAGFRLWIWTWTKLNNKSRL
jgi:hypothetical protein